MLTILREPYIIAYTETYLSPWRIDYCGSHARSERIRFSELNLARHVYIKEMNLSVFTVWFNEYRCVREVCERSV